MMKTNYLFIGMAALMIAACSVAIMKMNRKWMTDV